MTSGPADPPGVLEPGHVREVPDGGEVALGRSVERVLVSVQAGFPLEGLDLSLAVVRGGRQEAWRPVLESDASGRAGFARAEAPRSREAAELSEPTEGDRVDIDHLRLARPAEAIRVRCRGSARAFLAGAGPAPVLGDAVGLGPRRAGTGRVPFQTQRSLPPAIADRTCCPTAVTMLLACHGHAVPLAEVAAAVRDPRRGLYGNWLRAAAFATAAGHPCLVRQARSWADAACWLARGPFVVSIAYGRGELPGAVMPQTSGHLVLVTGLDGRGGVEAHDPAGASGEGVVFDALAFGRAWAGHGAVAIA